MSLQYFEEKNIFYQNVFISQYLFISILCLKMSSVYKPLEGERERDSKMQNMKDEEKD